MKVLEADHTLAPARLDRGQHRVIVALVHEIDRVLRVGRSHGNGVIQLDRHVSIMPHTTDRRPHNTSIGESQ